MPSTLERMQVASITDGSNPCGSWCAASVALGWSGITTPLTNPDNYAVQETSSGGIVFIATGRVDNCAELGRLLEIPEAERNSLSDEEVMRRAYLKWGGNCSSRIFGDWSFVAWHLKERQLVLCRDHHGNTPLYYYVDPKVFAFSTSRRALLELNLAPIKLDELYLAQYMTSWSAFHGERTLHNNIRRLPPAHILYINGDEFQVKQYWYIENTPELQLPNRLDYVEAFRDIFDEAVRCRLSSNSSIACTLSGGLDSSSVAVTAAKIMRAEGRRLITYTSVPFYETSSYIKTRFANEFPYAKATADFAGNIDLQPLTSSKISPIEAIRRALQINNDLCYGAGNLYWILNIQQEAQAKGCTVFMTGALGNGGVSWDGNIFSQPWSFVLKQLGWAKMASAIKQNLKDRIKLALPINLVAALQYRCKVKQGWKYGSAINPGFAQRLHLLEQMLHDPSTLPPKNPKEQRTRYFMPGRSMAGAYAAELAAAHRLEVRDPTADARVLAFTLSVPDRIYMDSESGLDRWLIREAMKGRLPDQVRLNRNRGVQAGDLVPRLRACASEVEAALSELARGPATEYVDVGYMRQVWSLIQTQDTPEARLKSVTILTRGIMAGLFVNAFYE